MAKQSSAARLEQDIKTWRKFLQGAEVRRRAFKVASFLTISFDIISERRERPAPRLLPHVRCEPERAVGPHQRRVQFLPPAGLHFRALKYLIDPFADALLN